MYYLWVLTQYSILMLNDIEEVRLERLGWEQVTIKKKLILIQGQIEVI